jgi:hypothetical protein
MKVTLYEHDKYEGKSITYTSNTNCLPPGWINAASSIVVEDKRPGRFNNNNSNEYVVFYNDCYSKGYSQSLKIGRYSGAELGQLKQNISSFIIYGNLRVKAYMNNDNLSGYSVVYENSVSCLLSSQNDKIASLVIERKYYQGQIDPNNDNYGNNSYATIYTNCYYGGNSLRLSPGYYTGDKLGLMKFDISSIEIPSNLRAKVFINNENLAGTSYILNENSSCLSATLNNRIGSIIIESKTGNNDNYPPYPQQTNLHVVLYEDVNYKGRSVSLLPGTYASMEQAGFTNDALSSLILPQGFRVVLYEHQNFGGKTYTVTASKSMFTLSGWNDKTSSIAVYRDY